MLKLAYPAIKKANPDAWVLVGGLSGPNPAFIRGIYEEGGRDYFDFMNIHTYGVPVVWPMMVGGYQAKQAMGLYGDWDRPLWNTEFGIDAGNLWTAWRVSSAHGFDEGHLSQWKNCITEALQHRLYWKMLPYQFAADNERGFDVEAEGIEFPEGHNINDYGFGLVRRDGKTPRPTYNWLLEVQVNRHIEQRPSFSTDIVTSWDGTWRPVGYEYQTAGGKITIKNVKIDSLRPTVIRLQTETSGN